MMSSVHLILESLRHHWRLNVAVALGVMAAVAVMTGALLVGDSVRGSLRDLTLDRLGQIDQVLVANRFFREQLASELAAKPGFGEHFASATPAVYLAGSAEHGDGDQKARVGQVTLLGVDEAFWKLGPEPLAIQLDRGEVALNASLAEQLAVEVEGQRRPAQVGDEVLVRFPRPSAVPEESALGRKSDTIDSRRLTVKAILPSEGLGRFGLQPNQQIPANAYVDLSTLQSALDQSGKANALLLAGHDVDTPTSAQVDQQLASWLEPTLEDYGLELEAVALPNEASEIDSPSYFNLTSQRMMLEEAATSAAMKLYGDRGAQPAFTYLANYITAGDDGQAKIPYSTVAAIHVASQPPLGPFVDLEGKPVAPLAAGEIALNRWAYEDMKTQGVDLKPGDGVRLTFFEPESSHGETPERSVTLRLKAIIDLVGPANDPHFTPEVQGITDQESINDWDPPFEFDPSRVRSRKPNDQDEQYWDEYQATPKAFVSLALGRELWSSRFGRTTSVRIPATSGLTVDQVRQQLREAIDPASLGFSFQPVKRQGLAAASGTTPFNLLFLGFSMFIIAAAMMLVGLLFRLGAERRAREVGILEAVGFTQQHVRRLMACEGLLVAALGGLAGIGLGVLYAWLMLAALRSPQFWLDAVGSPFLHLYVTPASLLIGYASGVLVSLVAIALSVWRMGRQSIRRLLAGQSSTDRMAPIGRPTISRWLLIITLPAAVMLGILALRLTGEAQAGAFFAAGALVLSASLSAIWMRLRRGAGGSLVSSGGLPLARLAARNAARNPTRSTLTIGLVAAATFLIVAISAFRLDPASQTTSKQSGSGGFTLLATSEPIYHSLSTDEGRLELGIPQSAAETLDQAKIIPLRVKAGDDASCLNLYQTANPRVLGISDQLVDRGGFAWGGSLAQNEVQRQNPWLLLQDVAFVDDRLVVPCVLDANTAMYSLHKALGDTIRLEDSQGSPFEARIVGLLKNSILQGDMLIAEQAFVKLYPDMGGARMFLIDTPPEQTADVRQALESSLGDFGFVAESTRDRLASFMAVQNTYLSTFQSLGGLGLLLGTFGLATVQLRNVLERRGELALLRATGFARSRLARIVMLENVVLLSGGLLTGVLSALVAVLPHLFAGGASVPWRSLGLTLGLVFAAGLLASAWAVRAILQAPLLEALRSE
jgi:ABC-type antimicrobial peptide transport system permease subunit